MIGHYHFIIPRAYTGCRLLQDLILFSIMTMSTCYTVIKGVPPPPRNFQIFLKSEGRGRKKKIKRDVGGVAAYRLTYFGGSDMNFFLVGVLRRGLRNFRRGIRNFQGGGGGKKFSGRGLRNFGVGGG